MGRLTDAVKHLLIINVILFFATQIYGDVHFTNGCRLWFPENENFRVWQVITHMFMHGQGFAHIGFNMLALWMFGTPVERVLGRNRFLFVYFSAGLGAVLFQLGYHYFQFLPANEEFLRTGIASAQLYEAYASRMVGASGCIMGILAAFGMMNPEARLMLIFFPVPIKAKYFIPGIILLDIISAITGQSFFSPSNTAYMAHVGGAFVGFLIMLYWKKNQFNQNRWD